MKDLAYLLADLLRAIFAESLADAANDVQWGCSGVDGASRAIGERERE